VGDSATDGAPDYRQERAAVSAPERVDPTTIAAEGDHGALLERPERYKVQFTATEEYVRLVQEAKALLSHAVPNVTLEELHVRAMRVLVTELKKKKYAAVDSSPARSREPETSEVLLRGASETRSEHTDSLERDTKLPGAHTLEQHAQPTDALDRAAEQPHPGRRRRYIPAAVRRAVFERDGNRCSYLDANGTRCPETHRLQFHHLKPFAQGGDHCPSNLTLRCAAHNALAAEQDFGRELIGCRRAETAGHVAGNILSGRADLLQKTSVPKVGPGKRPILPRCIPSSTQPRSRSASSR
jgi:hypothetical protein